MLCIFCRAEVAEPMKEWNYSKEYYHVKLYKCPKCQMTFMDYYHNGKFSHTIPKNVDAAQKVLAFLASHYTSTVEEIGSAIGLPVEEVMKVLSKLEKNGQIEQISTSEAL